MAHLGREAEYLASETATGVDAIIDDTLIR
jgi:hypothetical protein